MSRAVPFSRPVVTPEAQLAAQRALASGWLTTGPEAAAFEEEFASWVGAAHALAVSSCTAAIELSLRALRLPAGSRVLLPAITFCGVASAITHAGHVPLLADVDPDTMTMSPATAAAAATAAGGVEAMVVLHYAGSPAPVQELAHAAGVPLSRVVEDAAHAVGTWVDGRHVGSDSTAACFSFYATKNLPIGEGGMVTTSDEELADTIRASRLHGMSRDAWLRYAPGGSWRYDVVTDGLKANLPDVAAAVGRAQLRSVETWQLRREAIAAAYRQELSRLPGLRLPDDTTGGRHAWHLYPVRVSAGARLTRDALIEELGRRGIGTSVHFIPLHHLTHIRSVVATPAPLPGTERLFPELLSLPMYPALSDDDVDAVCSAVRDCLSSVPSKEVIA